MNINSGVEKILTTEQQLQKRMNPTVYENMDGTGNHYDKQNMPDTEKQVIT